MLESMLCYEVCFVINVCQQAKSHKTLEFFTLHSSFFPYLTSAPHIIFSRSEAK